LKKTRNWIAAYTCPLKLGPHRSPSVACTQNARAAELQRANDKSLTVLVHPHTLCRYDQKVVVVISSKNSQLTVNKHKPHPSGNVRKLKINNPRKFRQGVWWLQIVYTFQMCTQSMPIRVAAIVVVRTQVTRVLTSFIQCLQKKDITMMTSSTIHK
jgi:hypothetical protein